MVNLSSAISKYAVPGLITLLLAAVAYGAYQSMENQRLMVEVELYKTKSNNAITLDEINKTTARANEMLLRGAIDHQNEQFQRLFDISNDNSRLIIARIREQGAITDAHYQRTSQAINTLNIESCQGLIEALITFPQTGATKWPTTR